MNFKLDYAKTISRIVLPFLFLIFFSYSLFISTNIFVSILCGVLCFICCILVFRYLIILFKSLKVPYASVDKKYLRWVVPFKQEEVLITDIEDVETSKRNLIVTLKNNKSYNFNLIESNSWDSFKKSIGKM